MFPTLNEATAPMTYISKKEPISSHPHLYKSIMQSHDASLIENSNLFHPTLMCSVVSTNKRSQAEVFKVYFSLKYLECNKYNGTTNVQLMSAGVYLYFHHTGQPELSSPY